MPTLLLQESKYSNILFTFKNMYYFIGNNKNIKQFNLDISQYSISIKQLMRLINIRVIT